MTWVRPKRQLFLPLPLLPHLRRLRTLQSSHRRLYRYHHHPRQLTTSQHRYSQSKSFVRDWRSLPSPPGARHPHARSHYTCRPRQRASQPPPRSTSSPGPSCEDYHDYEDLSEYEKDTFPKPLRFNAIVAHAVRARHDVAHLCSWVIRDNAAPATTGSRWLLNRERLPRRSNSSLVIYLARQTTHPDQGRSRGKRRIRTEGCDWES